MALSGCGQMCKCILIIFNIVLAVVGCAMLGLGLWLRFSSQTQGFFDIDLNTQEFVIGVIVLMVLGAMLLLVAIVGDCGTCNEKKDSLVVYCCLLGVLAVALLATGILGYGRSDDVGERLANFYATVYAQYANKGGTDQATGVTLAIFHNALDCCGVAGAILDPFVGDTCPKSGFLKTFTMPPCPAVIVNLFKEKAPLVLGLFLGTAAFLVIALVCATILLKEVQRSKREVPVQYNRAVY